MMARINVALDNNPDVFGSPILDSDFTVVSSELVDEDDESTDGDDKKSSGLILILMVQMYGTLECSLQMN